MSAHDQGFCCRCSCTSFLSTGLWYLLDGGGVHVPIFISWAFFCAPAEAISAACCVSTGNERAADADVMLGDDVNLVKQWTSAELLVYR